MRILNTFVTSKFVFVSRKAHDHLLTHHNEFFKTNLIAPKEKTLWNIYGKGIECADDESAKVLAQEIERILNNKGY